MKKKIIVSFFRALIFTGLVITFFYNFYFSFMNVDEYLDYYNYFKQQEALQKFSRPQNEIVLVDIGELQRDSIVSLVEKVEEYEPKVLGMKINFTENKANDSLLKQRLSKFDNLVFTSNFKNDTLLLLPSAIKPKKSPLGYSGFHASQDEIVDGYFPYFDEKGEQFEHFTTLILKKYDKKLYEKLINRSDGFEEISFGYTIADFSFFGYEEIFGDTLSYLKSSIKNKIVMLGYFPNRVYNNKASIQIPIKPGNKAIMMNITVIDANILAMAMNETWITQVDWKVELAFTYLLLFLLDLALSFSVKQLNFKVYTIYRFIHFVLFTGLLFVIFYINSLNYRTYTMPILWTFALYFEFYATSKLLYFKKHS